MAFWLGLYPSTFLSRIDPAVAHAVDAFKAKYLAEEENPDTLRMVPEPGSAPEKPAEGAQPGTQVVVPL
jgi:hypothetical protein